MAKEKSLSERLQHAHETAGAGWSEVIKEVVELEAKLKSTTYALEHYDKLHKHELRQLWLNLRDKYAIAALGLMTIPETDSPVTCDRVAMAAFTMADAMMARRDCLPDTEIDDTTQEEAEQCTSAE